MMTRQVSRRELFDLSFERYLTTKNADGILKHSPIPKGLGSRRERRNLARAYACRNWKIMRLSRIPLFPIGA
jgi:hypothetical protein